VQPHAAYESILGAEENSVERHRSRLCPPSAGAERDGAAG
jgi:hypothetical protein